MATIKDVQNLKIFQAREFFKKISLSPGGDEQL